MDLLAAFPGVVEAVGALPPNREVFWEAVAKPALPPPNKDDVVGAPAYAPNNVDPVAGVYVGCPNIFIIDYNIHFKRHSNSAWPVNTLR